MTWVNNQPQIAPLSTNGAIDELANQVRRFRRSGRARRRNVQRRANDVFQGAGAATPNAGFRGLTPDPFAQLFNALGFLPQFARMAAGATAGGLTPNAPLGTGTNAGAQQYLPFIDPRTGGLDPLQLATAFQGAGMDPMSSFLMGNLIGSTMRPEQMFQPLWNAMGGRGAPNLDQLGGAFAPQQARPELLAQANAAWNIGNINGLGPGQRPRHPVVAPPPIAVNPAPGQPVVAPPIAVNPAPGQPAPAPPVAVNPPARPPVDTPQGIGNAGQNNQRRILNRADNVLKELYGRDAVVVDNNTAGTRGRIDKNDVVEFTDQNGQRVQRVLGDKQFRELQMRTHTVEGAKILDDARKAGRGMGFQPDMNNPKVNPQFWDVQNGQIKLKPGVRPSEAVDDVFKNPNKYALDCAAGAHLVGLRAISKTIGATDFDRSHANLKLKGWQSSRQGQNAGGSFNHVTGTPEGRAGNAPKPGDAGYIKNPDNVSVAWQGENVIYLGNGQYFGHPGGIKSKDEWVNWINTNARKPGATQSAYMSSLNGDWGANIWAQNDFNTADSNVI